ncbi:MAG: hypothetical protein ACFFFK_02460 [Candidatus Thorarchaeota archaeon]
MACTTKQQTISLFDVPETIESQTKSGSMKVDAFDEKAGKYRRYLAEQEALRQLEKNRTNALALTRGVSLFR